jgi:hypothetical protein
MENKKIIVFVDSVGRNIYGELIARLDKFIKVKNPAIINIVPNPNSGQLQVQVLPYFFTEFLKNKDDISTVWDFSTKSIVEASEIELDEKLVAQYEKMFTNAKIITPDRNIQPAAGNASQSGAKVVKLFE